MEEKNKIFTGTFDEFLEKITNEIINSFKEQNDSDNKKVKVKYFYTPGSVRDGVNNEKNYKKMLDEAIAKLSEKESEINKMRANGQENYKRFVNENRALEDKNKKVEKIIDDKILSEGYKISNDIKMYIEFARQSGKLTSPSFIDMINRINNVITSFIDSRKPVC